MLQRTKTLERLKPALSQDSNPDASNVSDVLATYRVLTNQETRARFRLAPYDFVVRQAGDRPVPIRSVDRITSSVADRLQQLVFADRSPYADGAAFIPPPPLELDWAGKRLAVKMIKYHSKNTRDPYERNQLRTLLGKKAIQIEGVDLQIPKVVEITAEAFLPPDWWSEKRIAATADWMQGLDPDLIQLDEDAGVARG